MNKNNLSYRVSEHTNTSDDRFVGVMLPSILKSLDLKCEVNIKFPRGFYTENECKRAGSKHPEKHQIDQIDKLSQEERQQLLEAVKLLSLVHRKALKTLGEDHISGSKEKLFPFDTYRRVIEFHVKYGKYNETEKIYKKANFGKVNWSKTIKKCSSKIVNNSIIFTDFIVSKQNILDDYEFQMVYEFCVWQSFHYFGWLFGFRNIPYNNELLATQIKTNIKYFKSLIQSKIRNTHNEEKVGLLKALVEILENEANEKSAKNYGTEYFHRIWEEMIDHVFGNTDAKLFYPSTKWNMVDREPHENAALRPDTILITDDEELLILDAKYYGYEQTGNINDDEKNADFSGLPGSSDIFKQIEYAEFAYEYQDAIIIKAQKQRQETPVYDKYKIYNLFLLPAGKTFDTTTKNPLKYKGYADESFISSENKRSYHNVHCILVNTKWLMREFLKEKSQENSQMMRNLIMIDYSGIDLETLLSPL